jgi:hypothetical protein
VYFTPGLRIKDSLETLSLETYLYYESHCDAEMETKSQDLYGLHTALRRIQGGFEVHIAENEGMHKTRQRLY